MTYRIIRAFTIGIMWGAILGAIAAMGYELYVQIENVVAVRLTLDQEAGSSDEPMRAWEVPQ